MIARFAEATKPELRALADEQTRALADLVARRRQIIQMIAAERQLAREGGSPGFRTRHRVDHGSHTAGRNARAGEPRPAPSRLAGRACALDPPIRPVEGKELYRRWTLHRTNRPVHGIPNRHAPQPHAQSLPSTLDCCRQAQDGCPHRRRPQTSHYPQRYPARQTPMANRLTRNTVALPRSGGEGVSWRWL